MPRPRGPRWLFGAALVLSALVHLLVFLVLRFSVIVPGEARLVVRRPAAIVVVTGMRAVSITPVAQVVENAPRLEESPEPLLAPTAPPRIPLPEPPAAGGETGGAAPRVPRTLTERIRPRAADRRLWVPLLPPAERALTPDEAVRARVADRLTAWNDSMAAEAAAATRALDWTHTDAEGNKWGISPGKIHLGSLTIPLPFGFGPPPYVRDALNDRVAGWGAIERQAAQGKVRDDFKDRVKAIREMREAKRDTTKKKN